MENEESQSSNILHYIAYSILTLGLGVMGYFYYHEHFRKPLPQVTNVENVEKVSRFGDLPYEVRTQYVTQSSYKNLQKKFDDASEQKQTLLNENAQLKEQLQQAQVKMESVETPQEAVAIQSSTMEEAMPPQVNETTGKKITRVKEFAKCYDMPTGSYAISKTCRNSIVSFIDKHKNAQYFEIIGLVDETEFTLYKNLEINNFIYDKLGVNQHSINSMKKFTQFGLAKFRAIEANWVIKVHTKRKAKAYTATYNLLSKDGKKGIIIRAYE
ncbi:MAG: hypothetical protein ACNI3C_01585 [Candidatus Marinarcus sp.]|uniref:hypothetical protein n=1 Tax=Candidatus Marinarcus sp. TaxID=3100987 RepID=UPI003B009674